MYEWNVYQVYRAKKDYDNYGSIITNGTLLQIWQYEGSSISLKSENDNRYFINARDLLNEENFQRVF